MSPCPCTSCSSIFFFLASFFLFPSPGASRPPFRSQFRHYFLWIPGKVSHLFFALTMPCASPTTALVCFLSPKGHLLLSRYPTPRLVLDWVTRLCAQFPHSEALDLQSHQAAERARPGLRPVNLWPGWDGNQDAYLPSQSCPAPQDVIVELSQDPGGPKGL